YGSLRRCDQPEPGFDSAVGCCVWKDATQLSGAARGPIGGLFARRPACRIRLAKVRQPLGATQRRRAIIGADLKGVAPCGFEKYSAIRKKAWTPPCRRRWFQT